MSSGPYQHLRQARMRSIELGLRWCARPTPAFRGDRSGRPIVHSLPLGTEGVLDTQLRDG